MIMQPQTGSFNDAIRRTVIAGMAGGTVSAITGGKFANGAVTSAIQWWFNAEDSPNKAFADERGSIELLLKGGKGNYAEAMLRTIKLYKIDMSHNGKVITPEIRLDLPSEGMVTTGKLFLGSGAFVNGAGYLGSTIQHEMVHVRFGSLYFDFQVDTLNRMEVEA